MRLEVASEQHIQLAHQRAICEQTHAQLRNGTVQLYLHLLLTSLLLHTPLCREILSHSNFFLQFYLILLPCYFDTVFPSVVFIFLFSCLVFTFSVSVSINIHHSHHELSRLLLHLLLLPSYLTDFTLQLVALTTITTPTTAS